MLLNARTQRTPQHTTLLLAIISCLFFRPTPAQALGNGGSLPDFAQFSKSVQNNQPGILRGVYVQDILAFPVVQQPSGNAGYVSLNDGEITQFDMAADFNNIGLLAHNTLSGRFFSQLAVGQSVRLVYGDGKVEYFVITQVLSFQALDPTNPYSSFRDLSTNEKLTADQLFRKVYRGDRHVTFQTCIERADNLSWGRLFVIAEPRPFYSGFNHLGLQ